MTPTASVVKDVVGRPWVGRLGAVAVFLVMSIATVGVWWNEVDHDRQAIRSHSSDVCRQAARRLEVIVERSLTTAMLFTRWLLHDKGDRLRERFEGLAALMVAEVPGFHSAHLIPPGEKGVLAPRGVSTAWPGSEPDLIERSREQGVILSGLVPGHPTVRFFAAIPMEIAGADHGTLVVEFDAAALVDDGFRSHIRSEFAFEVIDDSVSAYQFAPEGSLAGHPHRDLGATYEFPMRNRTWRFEVVPRQSITANVTGLPSAPVLGLGLLLSVVLAAAVRLLGLRMEMLRAARDQALAEIVERNRVEEALRASEQLYRGVFASATDGLVLIDEEDRILQANPAACRMHGWEPGALDGTEMSKLIAPTSSHLYQAFKERPAASGVFRADAVHERKDGSTIDVEVRGTRFSMDSVHRKLAILTNVTERNRAVQRLGLLSRKALMAQEEERARVSRDLHDELGQLLTASRFELGWLQKNAALMPEEASVAVGRAVEAVEKSADELRRICRGLRPPLLDDLGLEPAVQLLAQEFEERTGMKVDLESHVDESVHFTKEIALCTYRVLQESLNNVSRHARAKGVDVSLVGSETELILSVYDDGKGFDVADLAAVSGVGITGMRERASLVGGLIEIRSALSQGTRVVLRVPLSNEGREDAS
jgi:PAS domain S-box-containing protein